MSAELTQIIYKEEQRSECYPFANVYFNDKLTIFFENEVISKAVMHSEADKIGICSWKLKQKQRWNVGRPRPITEEVINSDYEVLSFTKNTVHHQMMYASEQWHPGFRQTLSAVCNYVDIIVPFEVSQPIYQNAFMASREIYRDYVMTYLNPVMFVMSSDPGIRTMVTKNSMYHELTKGDAAPREVLHETIGFPYYPMAPFLLERLFSIFCHNNKIKVTYI